MSNSNMIDSENSSNINTSNLYEVNANTWFGDMNFDLILSSFGKKNIDNYINDPMTYHNELNALIEVMRNTSGIFTQTIAKMVAAPSLGYTITPTKANKKNVEKRKIANNLLEELNHTLITRDSLDSHLTYGESVFILQQNINNNEYMLKPLHRDFVRFEGSTKGDHIVSFDMDYFTSQEAQIDEYTYLEPTEILKTFPKEFTIAYNLYLHDINKRWYTLNQYTTYATKFRGSLLEIHGRSIALPAIVDMLFSQEYTESQRNNLQKYSSKLVYMEQPAGEKIGSCSLNGEQQKKQLQTFLSAIKKQSNRTEGYAPLFAAFSVAPGTKIHELKTDPYLLQNTLKKENNEQISSDLGLGLGSISGNGGTGNYASLQLNIDLVMGEIYQFLEQAQKQYEKIINYILNSDKSNYIKFRYLKISNHNRKDFFQCAKDLYTLSGGSREYLYTAAVDDAQTYIELLELEQFIGYDNKFLPHITSFTASDNADNSNSEDNLGGRPQKNTSDMTEKGLETRSNGGNKAIKPSTK